MLAPLEEPGYDEPECQVEGLGSVLSPGMRSDVATWRDLRVYGGRAWKSQAMGRDQGEGRSGSRAASEHGAWARSWQWERRVMTSGTTVGRKDGQDLVEDQLQGVQGVQEAEESWGAGVERGEAQSISGHATIEGLQSGGEFSLGRGEFGGAGWGGGAHQERDV